jgi:hypothetical protein
MKAPMEPWTARLARLTNTPSMAIQYAAVRTAVALPW